MSRSNRHIDRYTDIRQQTQADVEREAKAALWEGIRRQRERSAKIKERIVTWAVIACLVVVVVRLFYVGTT